MARIRTLKPEFLEDETVARLSHVALRLWVGVILLADDYGNLRGALDYLCGRILHGCPEPDYVAASAYEELVRGRLVRPYAVRGQVYLAISNWHKHQKIARAGKAHIPGPAEADGSAPVNLDQAPGWAVGPLAPPPPAPAREPAPAPAPAPEVPAVPAPAPAAVAPVPAPPPPPPVPVAPPAPPPPVQAAAPAPTAAPAPELPRVLSGPDALRLVVRHAGDRVLLHPKGKPYPTETGASGAQEMDWCRAWAEASAVWGEEHLVALGKALAEGRCWKHLAKGVPFGYLTKHLVDGLQEAAGQPAELPAPAQPAAPRPAPRPSSEPTAAGAVLHLQREPVKGKPDKALAFLATLGISVPADAQAALASEAQAQELVYRPCEEDAA